jgi:hypothetical protein
MLVWCDRCGEIQPNGTWRCRRCRALLPDPRSLLRWLLAFAMVIGLVVLFSMLRPFLW